MALLGYTTNTQYFMTSSISHQSKHNTNDTIYKGWLSLWRKLILISGPMMGTIYHQADDNDEMSCNRWTDIDWWQAPRHIVRIYWVNCWVNVAVLYIMYKPGYKDHSCLSHTKEPSPHPLSVYVHSYESWNSGLLSTRPDIYLLCMLKHPNL